MTTRHEDESEPEPALAAETQAEAERFVKYITSVALANGWECVVVSVSRRIDFEDGRAMAPGATAMEANPRRMGPTLMNEAAALRKMAEALEKIAAPYRDVATHDYVQDKSDFGSGLKDWPR